MNSKFTTFSFEITCKKQLFGTSMFRNYQNLYFRSENMAIVIINKHMWSRLSGFLRKAFFADIELMIIDFMNGNTLLAEPFSAKSAFNWFKSQVEGFSAQHAVLDII